MCTFLLEVSTNVHMRQGVSAIFLLPEAEAANFSVAQSSTVEQPVLHADGDKNWRIEDTEGCCTVPCDVSQ